MNVTTFRGNLEYFWAGCKCVGEIIGGLLAICISVPVVVAFYVLCIAVPVAGVTLGVVVVLKLFNLI